LTYNAINDIISFMISLERVNPTSYDHLDRYMAMLEQASRVGEVQDHLPEIFEEGSVHRVQEGIVSTGALRYFVVVDGKDAGRAELTRHFNEDPSIVRRTPAGIVLGYNACYFINPGVVTRGLEGAHVLVADQAIRTAFIQGDLDEERAPWLPVSLDGDDVSRGWLYQGDNPWYTVHADEPQPGIFPQFGIGDNAYSIVHAVPNVAVNDSSTVQSER
jgi:hypothetical protein